MTGVLVGHGQYANTTQTQTAQICFYAPSPFFTQKIVWIGYWQKLYKQFPPKKKTAMGLSGKCRPHQSLLFDHRCFDLNINIIINNSKRLFTTNCWHRIYRNISWANIMITFATIFLIFYEGWVDIFDREGKGNQIGLYWIWFDD